MPTRRTGEDGSEATRHGSARAATTTSARGPGRARRRVPSPGASASLAAQRRAFGALWKGSSTTSIQSRVCAVGSSLVGSWWGLVDSLGALGEEAEPPHEERRHHRAGYREPRPWVGGCALKALFVGTGARFDRVAGFKSARPCPRWR